MVCQSTPDRISLSDKCFFFTVCDCMPLYTHCANRITYRGFHTIRYCLTAIYGNYLPGHARQVGEKRFYDLLADIGKFYILDWSTGTISS